jgi:hypothetical protein
MLIWTRRSAQKGDARALEAEGRADTLAVLDGRRLT